MPNPLNRRIANAGSRVYCNMDALRELAQNILRHRAGHITHTAVPGLTLYFADSTRALGGSLIYEPMICILVQGEKSAMLGDSTFRYRTGQYLINSVELPVTGSVKNAAANKPYLSLSVNIDLSVLSDLLLDTRTAAEREPRPGITIGNATKDMLDCFARLTRLLDEPESIPHLAPLYQRELLFRVLHDEGGQMLRQVATQESRTAQVARAMRWIRNHYAEAFSISQLAEMANMSVASLHRHFRTVTAMSPLQYQKQIRLMEARRLLLTEQQDAATAAFHVGYASPSQFSREYSRAFGRPPRQDADHLLTAMVM